MSKKVASNDLYLNADKSKAVDAKSEEAAFLLARKGRPIPPRYADLVTDKGNPRTAKKESKADADKSKAVDGDKDGDT